MKPILFNTDMVRAILEDRKTVMRRAVKPQPLWRKPPIQQRGHPEYWANWDDVRVYKSHYRPGDILYVKEMWCHIFGRDVYRADFEEITEEAKMLFQKSGRMPCEAARIFLKVTGVRVERLQEICGQGLIDEGLFSLDELRCGMMRDKFSAFEKLWNTTIKPADHARYGWDANPWVWVIEFERCEKPEVCT